MNCEYCNKEHDGNFATGRFCNIICSRGFATKNKRKEINEKVGKELKGRTYPNLQKRIEITCKTCKTVFRKVPCLNRQYCSLYCANTDPNKSHGGYRKGSSRGKSGYYKGIHCDSTYELAWVIYNLDHNFRFERFNGYILYDIKRKYFPDFIQDDGIIEIKNFYTEEVKRKTQAAIDA
ncbi:MAG: hypothetical protein AABW88_04720, partial [Nanoarchaeota archaeon]